MGVLSATAEQQIEDALVKSGVLKADELKELKEKAKAKNTPLFAFLVSEGRITDEDLTKATATATKVPYVNLTSAKVNTDILKLLPQEIAERYMAVPLGEMQHRLVVAMLDASNV